MELRTHLQVEERTFFKRIDLNLCAVILALNLIGLINLYSATHGVHITDKSNLFWMQIFWLFSGWTIFFLLTFLDYKFFDRFAYVIYASNVGALIAVHFFGKISYGAQRWLDLGFFRYQPSETMKLSLVLVLARILSRRDSSKKMGFTDLLWPGVIVGIPFIITVKQPDLGTAGLMALMATTMVIFSRVKTSILIIFLVLGAIAAPLVWNFGLKDYQKNRVLTFLSPGRDPRGTGYNSIQSKIAVGSGRIFGKGFRKGTQSQLEFLPERHTDFIFSVLSEEHGFVGSIFTLGLFVIIYVMSISIGAQARDPFGSMLVVGAIAYLFWHVFVNMGMVIGILPIVGAPLPLLSYGGSSLLSTMSVLGLLSSVAYRRYLF
ncbi:MAG: rod shape-determining protein RodA [Bdellovibrionales bacterium]|nr:rod shape-determining protein RodA [Bdellovibrionales bacterium]